MEEKEKQSGLCDIERSGTRAMMVVRQSLMLSERPVLPPEATAQGHFWVHGPPAAGVCGNVNGSCYHQKSCRESWPWWHGCWRAASSPSRGWCGIAGLWN